MFSAEACVCPSERPYGNPIPSSANIHHFPVLFPNAAKPRCRPFDWLFIALFTISLGARPNKYNRPAILSGIKMVDTIEKAQPDYDTA
jgi:hypothetical protein